jgi:TetR/AcrR family transcriptional regulator, regulator of autoinduction and epiphytic fitness
MANPVNQGSTRRRYKSTRRAAQAAETANIVIRAAGELFTTSGYAATSIDAIAARAEVSPETVYRHFGSKRALLLRWLDTAVVGDDQPVPLAERPEVDVLRAEPDRARRAEMVAMAVRRIHERSVDAVTVLAAAAETDEEMAQIWADYRQRGRQDTAATFAILTADTAIAAGIDGAEAWQSFDVACSPEVYRLLTGAHHWTGEQYERWLIRSIESVLE